jgi:hypothetical protein
MFLGHANSDPNNVHKVAEFATDQGVQGGMPLVRYPPGDSVKRYHDMARPDYEPEEESTAIFVGQVPNMMPLPYLAWAIDTITKSYIVTAVKHAKKSGCAVAFVRSSEKEKLFAASRKVLFDVIGYWCPETTEQKEKLEEYTQTLRAGSWPEVHKDGRIPKSCMVFEELGRPKQSTQPAPDLGHLQVRSVKKTMPGNPVATGMAPHPFGMGAAFGSAPGGRPGGAYGSAPGKPFNAAAGGATAAGTAPAPTQNNDLAWQQYFRQQSNPSAFSEGVVW